MKIKRSKSTTTRSVTLRIDENVMKKIDSIADKESISRQKLIETILKTVVNDKNFVLTIED